MAAAQAISLDVLGGDEFSQFQDRLRAQADLSKTNWFNVGGVAQWLFKPKDTEDLAAFLQLLPMEVPLMVLGVGSNVIIRDGGIDGVVIKLGRGFTDLSVIPSNTEGSKRSFDSHSLAQDDKIIAAGASCLDVNLAQFAMKNSIAGLEFMRGIPGTVGGAVRMNAGAYGSDIANVLLKVELVERDGMMRELSAEQLGFTYRNSRVSRGAIITRAWIKGQEGEQSEIKKRMEEISQSREETQPVRTRTGGSTFKNPPGQKAWQLIDQAGCRGLKIGGAQVSELHCNFMINTGDATASDLEDLGEEVIKRVKEKTGVTLEWEIKRIGKKL